MSTTETPTAPPAAKKPAPARPAPAPAMPPTVSPAPVAAERPHPGEHTVAVKRLWFSQGQKVDVPGNAFATAVIAGSTKKMHTEYRITYYPDRRHHLVELVEKNQPTQRRWVPESWCSWEPAA